MNKKNDAMKSATQNQLHDNTKDIILQALVTRSLDNHFFGQEKRLTRTQLCIMTHADDRKVRDAIEELRDAGEYVCITKDGRGYWYGTRDEYGKLVIADYKSRMASYQRKITAYERKGLDGQLSMDSILQGEYEQKVALEGGVE